MIVIDGAAGEGGGQVLRSAVALAMVTGTPVRVEKIRAGRRRPGLMRQHLTAVQAAAEICGGRLEGAAVGSDALAFEPGETRPGSYRFAVGTAGSTTLVLQTLLPALMTAPSPSQLVLEGGTHNPMAPPFPFLRDTFLPLLRRMGPEVDVTLESPGFYPAGGGRLLVDVRPCAALRGIEVHERGETRVRLATAIVARLPRHIGERELAQVKKKLRWTDAELHLEEIPDAPGPGNVVVLQVGSDEVTETFVGFGQVRVRAETVALIAVQELRRYLKAEVPVGPYLADQLLLPLALAGGGGFTTLPLSRHATTQIDLIGRFLDVPIAVERTGADREVVRISA
jgi:RNA 3'-terminal phosphate cyclase (ATP)